MKIKDPITGEFKTVTVKALDNLPIGIIMAYPSNDIPAGWLLCDGSTFDKNKYPDLYDILGSDTLPNLKGKSIVGYNSSDSDFGTLEKNGGSKTATLTTSNLPSHTHTYDKVNSATESHLLTIDEIPSHSHIMNKFKINYGGGRAYLSLQSDGNLVLYSQNSEVLWTTGTYGKGTYDSGFSGIMIGGSEGSATTSVGGGQGHTHIISTSSTTTGSRGSGTAFNILQPYSVQNYIIKAKNTVLTSGSNDYKKEMIDFFYPIGSYYETSDTTFNPNTEWGGTWVEDSQGLVTIGRSSSITNVGGETGSNSVTLTTSNLPSHTHTYDKVDSATESHTLTTSEIPSHTHTYDKVNSTTESHTLLENEMPSHVHSYDRVNSATNNYTLKEADIPSHNHLGYIYYSGDSTWNETISGTRAILGHKSAATTNVRLDNNVVTYTVSTFNYAFSMPTRNTSNTGGGGGHNHGIATTSTSTGSKGSNDGHTHTVSTTSTTTGSRGSGSGHTHNISTTSTTTGSRGSGTAIDTTPKSRIVIRWHRIA